MPSGRDATNAVVQEASDRQNVGASAWRAATRIAETQHARARSSEHQTQALKELVDLWEEQTEPDLHLRMGVLDPKNPDETKLAVFDRCKGLIGDALLSTTDTPARVAKLRLKLCCEQLERASEDELPSLLASSPELADSPFNTAIQELVNCTDPTVADQIAREALYEESICRLANRVADKLRLEIDLKQRQESTKSPPLLSRVQKGDPAYVAKEVVAECYQCHESPVDFTLISSNKKHCRACGHVFCDTCCPARLVVQHGWSSSAGSLFKRDEKTRLCGHCDVKQQLHNAESIGSVDMEQLLRDATARNDADMKTWLENVAAVKAIAVNLQATTPLVRTTRYKKL